MRGRARALYAAPPRAQTQGGAPSGGGQASAAPPSAATRGRARSPAPSLRPSAGGRSTGEPASVAPRAGAGPAQASTSTSSPLRNLWQRTPPVARPFGGYSA